MLRIRPLRPLLLLAVLACGGGRPSTPTPPATAAPAPSSAQPAPSSAASVAAAPGKAVAQPALVAAPLAGDTTRTTIHRLSNGMTVYLSPDHYEPSVVTRIAVRAGSRNDPERSTGLAHYLEHMVFKGTSELGTLDYSKEKPHLDEIATLYTKLRAPGADRARILAQIDAETQAAAAFAVPNEFDQLYRQLGVTGVNAFTSQDATVYVAKVPRNRISQWARVEALRYTDAVFRLFWPELEAVYEEKNRALDNPARKVGDALRKALFPRHGYGWSTGIGEIEHLKSPAYADMLAFFERYYTPQNMAIVLAGDVDETVLPVLEQEFSRLRRPAGDAPTPGELPSLRGRTELRVTVPANEGVLLAWPAVAASHADRAALELMDLILFDGRSGLIHRELLLPQKVANAGSELLAQHDAGWFELSADALAGQSHADLERVLLDLVGKLQRGEFSDQDVTAALLARQIQIQQGLETNEGRARHMLDAFMDGVEWPDHVARLDRMRALTRADIMRVASQYLTGNLIALHRIKGTETAPKITKPSITPVPIDPSRQSAFAKNLLAMPAAPIEPVAIVEGKDFQRAMLPTGELIAARNERNELFAVEFLYDHGLADDRLTCLALNVLMRAGAGNRTAHDVARQLHELGLSVTTRCQRDTSAITLSGLDRNLDAGVALLREWVSAAALDEATVKARVATELTERANAKKDPQAITQAQAAYAVLGADSPFVVVPSNKQLEAARPDQLRRVLAEFVHRRHRTSYFGPRDVAAAAKAVVLGDGRTASRPRKPLRYRPADVTIVTDLPTAQTHIWLSWPRRSATAADRAQGTMFNGYVAPVLFQEIREARGLAYAVTGGFSAGERKADASRLYAYVATQGDKSNDALDAVLATLQRPVDAARFATASAALVENYRVARIPPRNVAGAVVAWSDQGERADPRADRVARAQQITASALGAWLKAELARPKIVSVLGDRQKLDEAKLAKLGKVIWVPVDQLFGY